MPDFSYRHPYWRERDPAWRMAQHHYEGGRRLGLENPKSTPRYLKKFWTESEVEYNERLERAILLYDNLVRRGLKVYQSQLFRTKPVRDFAGKLKELGVENVDLHGTNANTFFDRVTERADLDGYHGVLIEMPKRPVRGVASEADAQAANLRPWCESITALQMVDWEVEESDPLRRGELNYMVLFDKVVRGKVPFESGTQLDRYRVYTRTDITTYEVSAGTTGEGTAAEMSVAKVGNPLGEVPIVLFYSDFVKPMRANTVFDDVVLSANALWNTWSVLDEGFYWQGFNLLTLQSDQDWSELKVGERRGVKIPKEATLSYTAPSPGPVEMGMARITAIVERVADLLFNRTQRQQPTAQVESAEKRAMDVDEFKSLLEAKASRAESSERKVWRLMAKAWGEPELKPETVTYNRVFQVDDRVSSDWVIETGEGIFSLAEWYMRRHPGVTDVEEAWTAVKENIKRNREVGTASQEKEAAKAALASALGAGTDEPPEEAEQDQATSAGEAEEDEAA